METTKSRTAVLSRVLRIVYVGVLLVHLIMWALNVKGQAVNRMDESSNLSGTNNWGSNPLGCTNTSGVYGLFNSYSGKSHETLDLKRRHVRNIYTSQIGVREKQANSGPEVEKYLRYVNLPKGNPWCAAFVCWALGEAGVPNPRTGWSPGLFGERYLIWGKGGERGKVKVESVHRFAYSKQAENQGLSVRLIDEPIQTSDFRLQTSDTRRSAYPPRPITDYRLLITSSSAIKPPIPNQLRPEMGDIFGLYFPEKGRVAHVGFVDDWKDGWVTTVEGNTNVLGSREGDGVYRKRRLVRSIYKVARYVE